jgi:hypothetical protein
MIPAKPDGVKAEELEVKYLNNLELFYRNREIIDATENMIICIKLFDAMVFFIS